MADVSIGTLVMIAFFTGLGSGIGTPFGNFLFKKYWEPKLQQIHEKVQSLKPTEIGIKIPDNDKIVEMFGRK